MSPSLENLESQWLAQYAAVRQTLVEFTSKQMSDKIKGYGHDVVFEDEDFTGSSSSDDLWNMFNDDEQGTEYSSDIIDSATDLSNPMVKSAHSYGQEWLRSRCVTFAGSKPGINAEELQQRLSAMLTSDIRGLHIMYLSLPEIDLSCR